LPDGRPGRHGIAVLARNHNALNPVGVRPHLDGSSDWWIGLAIYGVALVTMAIDWLAVRWLRAKKRGWEPWDPPRWLESGRTDGT
jgi:hypothetical protein